MLNKKGLTLVEVLITGAISVFVILTLFILLRSGQSRLEETSHRSRLQQINGVTLTELKEQIRASGRAYTLAEFEAVNLPANAISPEIYTTPYSSILILLPEEYSSNWRGWMVGADHVLLHNVGGSGGVTQAKASFAWVPYTIGADTVLVSNVSPFQMESGRRSVSLVLGSIKLKSIPNESLVVDPILVRGRLMQWRLPDEIH